MTSVRLFLDGLRVLLSASKEPLHIETKIGPSTRTVVAKVSFVSRIVRFPVVSVRSGLSRVRRRFRGRLSASGVSTGTRGLRPEGFYSSREVFLLLLLLLETSQRDL